MSPHGRIVLVLAIAFGLMALEARRSRRLERALRRRGAIEPAGDVYPVMQILYPLAFLGPALEGWLAGRDSEMMVGIGAAVFAAGKALKYWAIATLGDLWTFRVLVVPGAPLVNGGPYRFLRHPNYLGVAAEIAGAALLFGAPWSGAGFTILFGGLMQRRIRVEERALAAATRGPFPP
jgi:methyltransferase